MTERQALVKAMLAEPDDHLPRLVFADWLDEHGDPDRAAFTRLQVEAAKRPQPEHDRLLEEAAVILDRHRHEWLGPVSLYHRPNAFDQGAPSEFLRRYRPFRRGMLGELRVQEDEFIRPEVQEQLSGWAADNGVQQLTLVRDPSVRASWSRLGTMAGVLVNTLRGQYTDGERPVLEVVASPVLASVAALNLTGSTADDHGLHALARSSHVGLLSNLILNDPHCTDVGLDALARAHHLPNLRELRLHLDRRLRFTAEGVLKVVASDRLPKFTSLVLGAERPVRFDLARVLHHPAAARLTRLRLETADALQVVAQSRYLTRLESLVVSGRRVVVDSTGVNELLANPALTALRDLTLHHRHEADIRLRDGDWNRLSDRFGDGFSVTSNG